MTKKVRLEVITIFLLAAMLVGGVNSALCSQKPMPIVTVKIVADKKFASQEVWQRKAALQLMDIADDVKNLLGVELKIVGFAEYRRGSFDDLYDLASGMADNIRTDDADVLAGFTYGPCPKAAHDVHTDGLAIPFRCLVIRNYYAPCDRSEFIPYALIHELVHLFGGVHVGQGTLMSPVLTGNIYLGLDPINRAIVSLTRDVDFKRGYASLDQGSLEKLAELYRQAIAASGGDETVLTDLAEVYRALGRYTTALEIYRGILKIDSSNTRTWLNMADCYFDDMHADSAFALLETALEFVNDSGQVYYQMARLYYEAGEFDRAYNCAAKAAWRGMAVDSAFLDEIKNHYVPGQRIPEERK
jgi:hypothetical protein